MATILEGNVETRQTGQLPPDAPPLAVTVARGA